MPASRCQASYSARNAALASSSDGARKELGLEYADRVCVWLDVPEELARVVERHREELRSEVLADTILFGPAPQDARAAPLVVESFTGTVALRRA